MPIVDGPFTINGTSEITGFGDATWITVEDVTNPADPVIIAGFNPNNPVPTANSSNSTTGQGKFAVPIDPDNLYTTDGVHTYEVFATDNAGSVGNIVKYTFDFQEKADFAFKVEPVATAIAGTNFAASPAGANIVVYADDTAGNLIDTYNGVVSISLANSTNTIYGTLTAQAVNGIAVFSNLDIELTGTYQLEANGTIPTPSTTVPGISTSITITPAAPAQAIWATEPPSKVTQGFGFGAVLNLEDQFGNLEVADTDNVSVSLDYNGEPDTTDLGGTDTVAANGTSATFSNIIINALGSPYTLIASSDGFSSVPSTPIQVIEPQLVVTSQPTSPVTAGVGFTLNVAAETYTSAVDTQVSGTTLTLTIVSGPPDATIGGTSTAVVSAGLATFDDVQLYKAGSYVLQVSGTGLLSTDTTSITVVAQATAAGLYLEEQIPASVEAGAGFGFTVGAEDEYGNPTTLTGSVSVELDNNPGGSNLGGTTTVTAGGNLAIFSGLTLNKVGTDYTLLISNGTLPSLVTPGFAVTPAPATQLVIGNGGEPPSSVTAGQQFDMVVDAIDPFGNLDTNFDGPVTIALPGSVPSSISVDAVAGVASYSTLALDTVGTYKLQATDSPLTPVTSTSVKVVAQSQPGQLVWTTEPPAQVLHNLAFGATVDVEDQFGNLETNYNGSVTIQLDTNPYPGSAVLGGTTTITASGGVATFSGLSINVVNTGGTYYTLQASSDGLHTPASSQIDVIPVPAASLQVTTQPTTVDVYQPFGLTITVLDQFGNRDLDFNGSVTVTLAPTSASNVFNGTMTVNASGGIATFSVLTLDQVGNVTLQLTTGNLSVDTGTINVTAAPASQLVVVTQPLPSVTAGAPINFEVEAEDPYGNLATSFNGVLSAALAGNGGKGTLGGPATAQAIGGIDDFSNLTVDLAGLGYTLTITSTSPSATVTTSSFSVTPNSPDQLVIASQPPATVTAGAPFDLTVDVEDVFGNVATSFNGPVNIGLSYNQSAAPLYGDQGLTASDGIAAFSGLSVETAGTGYTIVATSNGLATTISNPIDVVPGTANHLAVTVPAPTTMIAGSLFGLAVAAEDQYDNIVNDYTGDITIALENNPGHATLLGGPFVMVPTDGVSNFSPHLILDTAASGYTLQATSPGLTPVTSNSVTVTAAPATQLVVQTEPPSTPLSSTSTFRFVVAAEDPYGNVNTTYTGMVQVMAPVGSGASLSGNTVVSASGGLATFTGLTVSGETAPVSLQVTGNGLTGTTTTPVARMFRPWNSPPEA